MLREAKCVYEDGAYVSTDKLQALSAMQLAMESTSDGVAIIDERVRSEIEDRLRQVLKAKEESDAHHLSERRHLLDSVQEHEKLQSSRNQAQLDDARARFSEAWSLVAAWERRESTLIATVNAANAAAEEARENAQSREQLLIEEVESVKAACSRREKSAEERVERSEGARARLKEELEELRSELETRVRRMTPRASSTTRLSRDCS